MSRLSHTYSLQATIVVKLFNLIFYRFPNEPPISSKVNLTKAKITYMYNKGWIPKHKEWFFIGLLQNHAIIDLHKII